MSAPPSAHRRWSLVMLAAAALVSSAGSACGDEATEAGDPPGGNARAGAGGAKAAGGAAGTKPGASGTGGFTPTGGSGGSTGASAGAGGGPGAGTGGGTSAGAGGSIGAGAGGAAAGAGGSPAGAGGAAAGKAGAAGKPSGTAGAGGKEPEPEPCTTRITYGSRWIHDAGHPGFDIAQGNVTWDGSCTHDGANSYATLSNGWKPYFEGHGCTIAFDRAKSCTGAPTSCSTRIGYGPAWLAAPNHPNKFDDAGGSVTWSGQCNANGNNSTGVLSNGWTPTFAGKNNCELSFVYQQCGGLYTNPVIPFDCPDPGVIRVGDDYHMVCTGGNGGGLYVIRSSKNLINWKDSGHIFPSGKGPGWADGSYWAPEIHPVDGGFVAYFSAHEKGKTLAVGAATSKGVLGPFTDVGGPIVRAGVGAIDVNQFADAGGGRYLTWKDDGNSQGKPTPIHGQKLAADGHTRTGNAVALITNDRAWEGNLVEAPWVVRHDGKYYLFYSANAYYNGTYAVGVARSDNPLGPYTKKGPPILTSNSRWVGPGHCSVLDTPEGKTMMVYHAWRAGAVNTPGSGRVVLVDEVVWRDGWPEVPSGPSFQSKPMP